VPKAVGHLAGLPGIVVGVRVRAEHRVVEVDAPVYAAAVDSSEELLAYSFARRGHYRVVLPDGGRHGGG
jgi:hypothetical protein